jgi:hypothetical protein
MTASVRRVLAKVAEAIVAVGVVIGSAGVAFVVVAMSPWWLSVGALGMGVAGVVVWRLVEAGRRLRLIVEEIEEASR